MNDNVLEDSEEAISEVVEALLGPEEVNHIFRWDLDKTYLSTDFDSFKSLVRIAFESAEKKINVPGASSLLRNLSLKVEDHPESHIHFISGSPRQMRRVIEKKLELDGITYRSLHLKPNLENLARGRFRAVKEQVGYKLPLLLRGRIPYAAEVTETLFGDDAESDAYIYSLYADFMAGLVEWEEIETVLRACGVYPDIITRAAATQGELERGDCVERIYINLDRRSRLDRFDQLSEKIVPVYNYWQAALCLFAQGRLQPEGVVEVGAGLLERYNYTAPRLRNSTEDLMRRRFLSPVHLKNLIEEISPPQGTIAPLLPALQRLANSPPTAFPPRDSNEDAPRDYLSLLAIDRQAREAAKSAHMAAKRSRLDIDS